MWVALLTCTIMEDSFRWVTLLTFNFLCQAMQAITWVLCVRVLVQKFFIADELKSPEPEPDSEPEKPPQIAQPQMIQSFSPAVVASVAAMVPQPQMPVMVRPFQLNPFGSKHFNRLFFKFFVNLIVLYSCIDYLVRAINFLWFFMVKCCEYGVRSLSRENIGWY